ncbi:MAG: helix-turn-helix transcriptional regulator [Cyanobacteria bacterium J06554_11]
MVYSRQSATTVIETPEAKMKALLRGVRAEANISQEELGIRIGRYFCMPAIAQKTVSRWENPGETAEIPSCYIGAVAEACGVSSERLMI